MAYLAVQINVPGASIGDMNGILDGESGGGTASKPHEIIQNLKNLLDAINSMQQSGTVGFTTSTAVVTNSGATGGVAIVANLL